MSTPIPFRDVQCISCDKDVVMKTEEVGGIRLKPLPCTTSIKPYLTYELDKIRKQRVISKTKYKSIKYSK